MRKIVIDDSRDFKGAWIPAEIYTISELSWTEKILLIEIINLNKLGKCYAHNQHFANMLGVSTRQVSKMVSKLTDLGYVKCEIVRDTITKEVKERIITPMEQKFVRGIEEKFDRGIEQKFQEKNTLPKESISKEKEILVSDSVKAESKDSEPLFDKKYGIPENLGLIGEDRKQIWIDTIQYHIERQIGWSRRKHRKHKPEYWREHITESDEMLEFDRRVELSTEWTHRIIDYYFTVVKPRGDGEFAALWNKKMLMGILNKLCGGSKYDYYKAGMIENEPEIWEESYAKVESNILEFV